MAGTLIRKEGKTVTKAEKELFGRIAPEMKEQAAMIWKIEKAWRKKVKAVLPTFDQMPVAQAVTNVQGEQVLKNNPAMQEIRAILAGYISVVKTQNEILEKKKPETAEVNNIEEMRKKLKIAL